MVSWSPFVGVHGWSVRAVVGCLWVEAWALLVAYDRLLAGVLLVVVVVVGAITGGVGGLVGDVALSGLGPGGLLLWVTHMVVVGGIIAAMGTLLGW